MPSAALQSLMNMPVNMYICNFGMLQSMLNVPLAVVQEWWQLMGWRPVLCCSVPLPVCPLMGSRFS